jgi:hypothetical protein
MKPIHIATIVTLLAAASCGRGARAEDTAALSGGAPSVEALGRGVVEALAAGDTSALEGFRTTEREHTDLLWPRFPAAASGDPALAWENVQMRNAGARAEWILALRGRRVRFDRAECTGAVEEYETFQILRDCTVTVTDLDDGRASRIHPFDRVVRMGAIHKVIRYVEVD